MTDDEIKAFESEHSEPYSFQLFTPRRWQDGKGPMLTSRVLYHFDYDYIDADDCLAVAAQLTRIAEKLRELDKAFGL